MTRPAASFALAVVGAGVVTAALVLAMQIRLEVRAQAESARKIADQVEILANEVTRLRIEQSSEGKGPQALLEKLRTYAPILVSARTPQPDYEMARQQMDGVLRAFASLGHDGFTPVRRRFDELEPKTAFDELRWLLEAGVRCDADLGTQLVADVLAGTKKPWARLRWVAADMMLRIAPDRARSMLRQILLTESSRGVDPDRAVAYSVPLLDPAAIAVSGFHNFVLHYLRSNDPQVEDTLLQVLMRVDHDVATLQETIEALGKLRSAGAENRILELYHRPPGASQNPLFLNKCLDALFAIKGPTAGRTFLEGELAKSDLELVQKHIRYLLDQDAAGQLSQHQEPSAATPSAVPGVGK